MFELKEQNNAIGHERDKYKLIATELVKKYGTVVKQKAPLQP